MFELNEPSLFDPENLQELALLRQALSSPPAAANVALPGDAAPGSSASDADQIFERFRIDDGRTDWELGVFDVDIIHRGKIRIATSEWPPLIRYCKLDLTENNIVKQFRLHVLRHFSDIRLLYGTYRFRPGIAKTWATDYRCGKLVDAQANVRETMTNLAYWLTAQPHAGKNFATWEGLIAEAVAKLDATR